MFLIIPTVLTCCVLNINSASIPSLNERDFAFLSNPPRFDVNAVAIMPGTYWCGNGNISREVDDLGLIDKTDKCCRAHDMCPDGFPAGEYKYGLHNDGWFTRSHCKCDEDFYNCLKAAGNALSITTGTTYFTFLGSQCFKKFNPITKCAEKSFGRCNKYEFDLSEPETWQWYDNPRY